MDNVLKDLTLPSLSASHWEILEKEITIEELLSTIKQAKAAKTPDPEGFSAVYYKKSAAQLAPHLFKFFMAVQNNTALDADSNRANKCLIPKPDKDHTDVANYRPIFLINNLKFLTKYIHVEFVSGGTGYRPDPTSHRFGLCTAFQLGWCGSLMRYVFVTGTT